MKLRLCSVLLALALPAAGQRHKVEEVNAEKPDGKLLQQIMQENDAGKKTALLEQFSSEFGQSKDMPWVLEQLQSAYVKANDIDKTLAAGDKLLALDPDDPEAGMQNLKAAEAKKDPALIKKYAVVTSAAARKMAAAVQPKEAEEMENWKAAVQYAKQVDGYTEYALYRAAVESRDPKATIDLGETLRQQSPKSEYTGKMLQPLFVAYRQANENARALALAEQVLATDQTNEDMLLVVADNYAQQKKEPEKVHAYSTKIVEIMATKPKPEGVADADWAARKTLVIGLAHYMSGKLYYTQNNFARADTELRAALPMAETNASMKPEVLFLLGYANYQLKKPQDAANYYKACAAIKSQFQAPAAKSLLGIKNEYHGIQ
jgi:regulator of sirC expression with transglutaminase-like and TPR domain